MVSYDSDMIPNFGLGTKAIYSCNNGNASDSVKTCMVDDNEIDVAMWSGQNLHCARSHYSYVQLYIHCAIGLLVLWFMVIRPLHCPPTLPPPLFPPIITYCLPLSFQYL